jgi:hypothetical protein
MEQLTKAKVTSICYHRGHDRIAAWHGKIFYGTTKAPWIEEQKIRCVCCGAWFQPVEIEITMDKKGRMVTYCDVCFGFQKNNKS